MNDDHQPRQVPQDQVEAGHSTNMPRPGGAPESLDDDLSRGSDREKVDPHHSITRPNQPVISPGNDASLPETDNDDKIEEGESLIPKQAEDNATPFSPPQSPVGDPAADVDSRSRQGQLDPTHQRADDAADIDPHQLYDEGLAGAAEASEPNAGNAVTGYHPAADKRKNQDGPQP